MNLSVMKKGLVLCCITFTTADIILAQDTQYWTQQFGTRSALMGGAVIGGSRDNTMIYYNPAGLAFLDTASVSVNATAYQLQNINIANAIGQSADFNSSQIAAVPFVLFGILKIKDQRWRIGYAYITPVDFSFKATARIDNYSPIVDDNESPGDEEFIGQQTINSSLYEDALCLAISYKLNDRWSLGLTNIGTYRSHTYTKAALVRFFLNNTDKTLVTSTSLKTFTYYHVRYAARFGVVYRGSNIQVGLTVTPPGIGLFGTGTVAADITATNIALGGTRQDILADDRQSDLKSKFRAPFAINGGVNFGHGHSLYSLSLGYFGSEAIYDILRAEPSAFVRPASIYQSLGSENFLRVKTAAKPVFNMALGYEQGLGSGFTLLAGVRNDRTYYDKALENEVGIKPDISSWDIYHFSGGTTLRKGRSSFSMGVLYSFGKDKAKVQEASYRSVREENFLQGATTITEAKYNTLGVMLGYSYDLTKN